MIDWCSKELYEIGDSVFARLSADATWRDELNALKEMNLKLFDEGHRVASYNHEHTSENDIVTTNRIIWLQFFNSKQSVSEEKVNGQLSLDAWFEETEKRYTS